MAVDIVTSAYERGCEQIILVSSDTDLIPAIKVARLKKVNVKYIGFSHMPSLALISRCNESKLLEKSDIQKFII